MSITEILGRRALCVALAPELLTAVVRSGKRVVAHSEVRIAPGDAEPPWAGALAAFQTYLRQAGPTLRGVPIAISVTTRWCQLSMLPWSAAPLHADGAERYRLSHFELTHGAAARAWAVLCDEAPDGQPRLACAIDAALLEGLRRAALDNGHTEVVVESVLSIAARAIGADAHEAIAVIEPGRLVLATLSQGRITDVWAQGCRGPWHIELPRAWQSWVLRAPRLGDIARVALVSLDQRAPTGELPAPFHAVTLPAQLAPAYAALTMMGC